MKTKTIRALRLERGWTQFDLALAVGVRPQTVYLWESGRRQPQVSQMRKLGVVFGICSDDIDLISVQDAYLSPGDSRADRDGSEFTTGGERSGRGEFHASGATNSRHNAVDR
jgi:DNA-binding XRE family transcriptional regulator